jgi:hypothetical protein
MSTNNRSTNEPARPHYAKSSRRAKAFATLFAVLISSSLLGGMLGLFEMQSRDAASGQTAQLGTPDAAVAALRLLKGLHA